MAELLLELLSEEIPARMQARAAEYRRGKSAPALPAAALRSASAARAAAANDQLEAFYAPRRSLFEKQILAGRATILRNSVASFSETGPAACTRARQLPAGQR